MSRKLFVFFLVAMSVASFAFANQPGSCAPLGTPNLGPPPPWYDWIANGGPSYNTCWDVYGGATFHDASTDGSPLWCGTTADRYWELPYGVPVVQQTIPITKNTPSTMTFAYNLEFIDPHYDYSDVLYAIVYDETTFTNLFVASWQGSFGNPCGTQGGAQIWTINSLPNLNGHTLLVKFTTRFVHSDVKARVKGISLKQAAP